MNEGREDLPIESADPTEAISMERAPVAIVTAVGKLTEQNIRVDRGLTRSV